MARRIIERRAALDRSGVAAHLGVAYSTVNHWHRYHARFGFPDGFTGDDEVEWFWLDDVERFHAAHLAAKRAELTKVDRRGDPDELVGSGTAARILGYGSYRNLPDTLRDHPDRVEELPDGRLRRYWYRHTIWAIADARTGRQSTGRTPGTTGTRKPHPYADDPRLPTAVALVTKAQAAGQPLRGLGAELAQQLGISDRTAQRLIAAAYGEHGSPSPPVADPTLTRGP